MEIHYYNPSRAPKHIEEELKLTYHEDLASLFSIADFMSISVPLLLQTHHLINKEAIAIIKDSVRILNTSRRKVVDEETLVKARQDRNGFAAGLDVHHNQHNVCISEKFI